MVKVSLPKVKILVQLAVFLQLLGLGLVFFKQVLCEICTREIKTIKNMDKLTINSAQLELELSTARYCNSRNKMIL